MIHIIADSTCNLSDELIQKHSIRIAHIPGIKVVVPSTPERAYGLLLAAIRDPDPVIFLEPKRIYRAVKQDFETCGEAYPLETCFIDREGRGREGPRKLLSGFKGYLQTDGYIVYDWFGKQKDITLLSCMAHARRHPCCTKGDQ